jgi:hypothetical protein
MSKTTTILSKRDGIIQNPKPLEVFYKSLPDGRYILTADSTKKRTLPQNNYYWSVVVPMVYEGLRNAGFDAVRHKEDAHEIMKALFLKIAEERNGLKIERVMSTTELKTVGFNEYLLNISVWAFDYLGISIPEPNQQMEMSL